MVRAYLVDTNVLLGIPKRGEASIRSFPIVLERLALAGTRLHYTLQNAAEFWSVFTRPQDRNGFGLPPATAARELAELESILELLPDSRDVYTRWREIVLPYNVSGIAVHDARLVATMLAHGISHLPHVELGRLPPLSRPHHGRSSAGSEFRRSRQFVELAPPPCARWAYNRREP